jgi:hypothetical protein
LKSWVKQKLLHNFRAAYVDVLSRQQSRFNRRVVDALAELAERDSDPALRAELAELRRRCDELAERVNRVEAGDREPLRAAG